uniref:Uncharacterized protein n=1 Tax=Arundo donax TaxID=35708 RepID=A0A0A8Y4G5_ARUDO
METQSAIFSSKENHPFTKVCYIHLRDTLTPSHYQPTITKRS